jgi:hypothetical protein
MPEVCQCGLCGKRVRVPDKLLGRRVKCPGCGVASNPITT